MAGGNSGELLVVLIRTTLANDDTNISESGRKVLRAIMGWTFLVCCLQIG